MSAPSNCTSTQANGVCSGCLGRGWGTQDHEVDRALGPDVDEVAGLVARLGVVLGRRHDDLAPGAA